MMAGHPVVQLEGVTKTYPGGVEALRGIDLTIGEGEFLAIVGPSGSGKSTLLQLIGCLDRPTTGTIRLRGNDTRSLSDRPLSRLRGSEIGFVFQNFHLVPSLSALDNVSLPLVYQSIRSTVRRDRAAMALERVGLGHRLKHRPAELSGGECQRVAVARALVTEPSVILADEPTGNLDSVIGAGIIDLFRGLHAEGATVAVITHDADLAVTLPRVLRIRDGEIESDHREPTAA